MYGLIKGPVSSSIHSQPISQSSSLSVSFAKFTMGLDGGRSIGMPKSSSESSSKLEFSDSEFVLGVKFKGGIDMGDGGRERDRDLGDGDGDLEGGDRDLEGGDGDLGGREGDLGGGDLCLFCQASRVLGESGGGIGIAGEPAHCSVSVFFCWPLKV